MGVDHEHLPHAEYGERGIHGGVEAKLGGGKICVCVEWLGKSGIYCVVCTVKSTTRAERQVLVCDE